ncbi:MAG TPA: cytochrome c oxidase subunit 3 [Solimonas sp.]
MTSSTDACEPRPALPFASLQQQRIAGRFGLWLFLGNEILFFGGFVIAYAQGRWTHPDAYIAASAHTDLLLGGIESLVLLISSFIASVALRSLMLDRRRTAIRLLLAVAVLGLLFLGLHGKEWSDEIHEHLLPGHGFDGSGGEQLFFFIYYVATGFHGLHVLIGVVLMAVLAQRLGQGRYSARHHPAVELSILYWHLVDGVWMLLFTLFYLVDRT